MAVIKFKTTEELRDLIADFKGFSWGSMKTKTQLGINKKDHTRTIKSSDVFGEAGITVIGEKFPGIGYDYRTSVLNKRAKMDYVENASDWEPQSLKWGKWWNGSKVIIEHIRKTLPGGATVIQGIGDDAADRGRKPTEGAPAELSVAVVTEGKDLAGGQGEEREVLTGADAQGRGGLRGVGPDARENHGRDEC